MKHELENDIWESFLKNSVIEYSLKELENSDYKYSFRIGRIVSNNTNEEE